MAENSAGWAIIDGEQGSAGTESHTRTEETRGIWNLINGSESW